MHQEQTPQSGPQTKQESAPRPVIHRVCMTCNNMFATTDYDERHCPKCKK